MNWTIVASVDVCGMLNNFVINIRCEEFHVNIDI